MTSLSVAASVVSASTASTSSATLVKTANGEYTAASVQQDPTDAAKLGLSKLKDGNYGTGQAGAAASQASSTTASAATRSSSATQAALATLTLGGS